VRRITPVTTNVSALAINLWTAHGCWFWSLVYPERHGGATGAAPTEAEAIREAQAAIELLAESANDRSQCQAAPGGPP
jgi:hypothetical protein